MQDFGVGLLLGYLLVLNYLILVGYFPDILWIVYRAGVVIAPTMLVISLSFFAVKAFFILYPEKLTTADRKLSNLIDRILRWRN